MLGDSELFFSQQKQKVFRRIAQVADQGAKPVGNLGGVGQRGFPCLHDGKEYFHHLFPQTFSRKERLSGGMEKNVPAGRL